MGLCSNDYTIGPSSACRRIDTTLEFSNIFFAFVPSLIVILLAVLRLPYLFNRKQRRLLPFAKLPPAGVVLLFARVLLACCGVAAVATTWAFWETTAILQEWSGWMANASETIAAVLVTAVVVLEHFRCSRPSQLPALYLLCSILLTSARVRTLALIDAGMRVLVPLGLVLASRTLLFLALQFSARTSLINGASLPPTATAGLVSRFFIGWIVPLLWRGFRQPLTMESLGSIDLALHTANCWSRLEPKWIKQYTRFRAGKTKQPLFLALFSAFKGMMLAPIIPSLIFSVAGMGRPLIVNDTVTFVQNPNADISTGWGIVGGTFLIYAIFALSTAVSHMAILRLALGVRGALMEAIYRKALLVKVDKAQEMGSAKASNLMSVDIQNITNNVESVVFIGSALVQTFIAMYIIYAQIGLSFLAAIVGAVLFFVALPFTTRPVGPARKSWAMATDKRVKFMSSVFRHIKAIKLSAYEPYILRRGLDLRGTEVAKLFHFMKVILITSVVTNWLGNFLSLAVIITQTVVTLYSGNHANFSTAKIFTVISTIQMVSEPLLSLGQRMSSVIAAWASFKRIEEFLLQDEKEGAKAAIEEEESIEEEVEESGVDVTLAKVDNIPIHVSIQKASFGLQDKVTILHDIDIQIDNPRLWMIAGRVGCGKSTLLQALLTELDLISGSFDIHLGRVGFCSQDPWLRNTASIRENITFMAPYNRDWYWKVVKAVNLEVDFKELSVGDATAVSGLSGGQKQRVALARAVYGRFDSLILDDVFSALDADTEAKVFDTLFGPRGLLCDRAVILATNQVYRLARASWITMLVEGRVAEQGEYTQLMREEGEMARLVREFVASEKGKGTSEIEKAVEPQEVRDALSEPQDMEEDKISLRSEDDVERGDAEKSSQGTVKWGTYWLYIKAMGYTNASFWFSFVVLASGISTSISIYLQAWTQSLNPASPRKDYVAFLGGYSGMQVGYLIAFCIAIFNAFLYAQPVASRHLHQWQLASVLRTSLDFFESRGAGQMVNRFNTDLFTVDLELPNHFLNTLFLFTQIIGSTILIIWAGPYMAAVMPVSLATMFILQRFYLRSGRELKRLDLISRSPIFTLFGETIDPDGLRTIRAMRAQITCRKTMTKRSTASQHPAWLTLAVRKWLELALNMFVSIINVFLVMIAILERRSSAAGILAVALTEAAQLNVQIGLTIVEWTHVEMAVTSLERIEEYINLPPQEEKPRSGKLDVAAGWLREGSVRFANVTARYKPSLPAALTDVSFSVKPGQRVGICGRSGSGKSTLLGALWRLIDIDDDHGGIFIDGIDIRDVGLHHYRDAMSIIPQDPLLLEVSLRENLDPEGLCSDAEIWEALEKSQLKGHVAKLENQLDEHITGDSSAFSRGQRQLLALARAILRHRPILALDEATSSIDAKTDAAIQETLRESFTNCTVLTIAHRITTIIDYDLIIVMHQGRMVEIGSPTDLLSRPEGRFRNLAVESGAVEDLPLEE